MAKAGLATGDLRRVRSLTAESGLNFDPIFTCLGDA